MKSQITAKQRSDNKIEDWPEQNATRSVLWNMTKRGLMQLTNSKEKFCSCRDKEKIFPQKTKLGKGPLENVSNLK